MTNIQYLEVTPSSRDGDATPAHSSSTINRANAPTHARSLSLQQLQSKGGKSNMILLIGLILTILSTLLPFYAPLVMNMDSHQPSSHSMLFIMGVAAQSSSSSSSTGVGNTTLPTSSSSSTFIKGMPFSNLIAVILCCVLVIGACVCLFCCARSQMVVKASTKRQLTQVDHKLQAKIDAARRGWKKADGSSPTSSPTAHLSLHAMALYGATPGELALRANEIQSAQMALFTGASMGGLGALKYEHLRDPEDFVDEPWATEGTKESLKRSGLMLDIVLTSQHVMYMSGLSGIIPFLITAGLPFRVMILKHVITLSDWYGPIEELEFIRCMIIAGCGCIVHFLAYLLAKFIFGYDRQPSILAEKTAHRIKAQTTVSVLPGVSPAHAPAFDRPGSINVSPSGIAEAAPTFNGRDPNIWPLRIFCIVALLSYGLLGFQAYISCDESGGRQYGITSTNSHFWPESAGKGPAITFLICVIIGSTAMIPIGFSLKLLALFQPRRVHPNLVPKHE